MKRCPKCNRSYSTDTQRFCTHDGVPLITSQTLHETIRLDSSPLDSSPPVADDDEQTRVIPPDPVPEATGEFDPFKTIMARPGPTDAIPRRDTQALPSGTLQSMPLPESGAAASGSLPAATSASLTPPPGAPDSRAESTLPSIPTTESTSAPLTSAPLASAPLASAPLPPAPQEQAVPPRTIQSPPDNVQPPPAKSKLPLVLGILAVLLVLGVGALGAAYFLAIKPALEKRTATKPEPPPQPSVAATPIAESSPSAPELKRNEPPPYSPPGDAVQFVNSKENLDGKLAEHYVDFSFYYPERWLKDPKAGVPGASNFAKVERRLPPDFTQENLAVGWYSSSGSVEGDQELFPTLVKNLSSQFAKSFSEYRKVSEGPTKAGVYDGYEFRFESASRDTEKGDIKIWGRVVLLPSPNGGKNGVTLLMLATSLAQELKGVGDVGEKGELSMVLESFRFGEN
jgi:hypothetical protein